jgi:hypothetical protein
VLVSLPPAGPSDKPALNGTVNGQNIQMSGKDIAQPIQIQAINLKITPTQIQSAPFNVVSGGKKITNERVHRYLNYCRVNGLVKVVK